MGACGLQAGTFARFTRRTQQRRVCARLVVMRTRAASPHGQREREPVAYFSRVASSFAIAFVAAFVGASPASAFSKPKSWIVPS